MSKRTEAVQKFLGRLIILMGAFLLVLGILAVSFSAEKGNWPEMLTGIGFMGFIGWATWMAHEEGMGRKGGFGGSFAVFGFVAGAFLSLYQTPCDMLRGETAPVTTWQAACWLVGVGVSLAGLHHSRRAAEKAMKE